MALPPYEFGNYGRGYGTQNRPGNRNPYGYQNAMLEQLDPNYQYPSQVPQGRYPNTSKASQIAGAGAALAPTVIKQVLKPQGFAALSSGGNAGQGFASTAGGAGALNPVLSGPQSVGLGLATELGSQYLKPKGDLPTESPFPQLTDRYGRRMEGSGEGVAGGAVKWGGRGAQVGQLFGPVGMGIGAAAGGLGGAIGGLFTKNADSAMTDFTRQDAANAITELYRTQAGRLPGPGEVEAILLGQGSQPGDRWVGEKGLYSVLSQLSRNFAAEKGGAGPAGVPRGPLDQPATAPPGAVLPDPAVGANRLTGNPTVDAINARTGGGTTPGGGSRSDGVYGGTANTSLGTPQEQAQAPPGSQQSPLPPAGTQPPAPPAETPPTGKPPEFTGWGKYAGEMEGFDLKRYQRDIIGKKDHPEAGAKKILVAQIASTIDPASKDAVKQLVEKLKAAGQQVEFDGLDRIRFADAPQDGWIDVLKNKQFERTGSGPRAWHWLHNHGEGGGSGGGESTSAGGGAGTGVTPTGLDPATLARGYDAGGDVAGGSIINDIIRKLQRLSGNEGTDHDSLISARDAILNQFRVT